jgi:hypothetical protein
MVLVTLKNEGTVETIIPVTWRQESPNMTENERRGKELALLPLLSGPSPHCLVVITVTLFSEALVTVFNVACILILLDKYLEVAVARLLARTTLPFA